MIKLKALVTGASSGIGKETAISCSKMGAQVIITARNEERLQETFNALEGEGHSQIICDLTKSDELELLLNHIEKIDGVVLCAGRGLSLPVLFSTREKYDEIYTLTSKTLCLTEYH